MSARTPPARTPPARAPPVRTRPSPPVPAHMRLARTPPHRPQRRRPGPRSTYSKPVALGGDDRCPRPAPIDAPAWRFARTGAVPPGFPPVSPVIGCHSTPRLSNSGAHGTDGRGGRSPFGPTGAVRRLSAGFPAVAPVIGRHSAPRLSNSWAHGPMGAAAAWVLLGPRCRRPGPRSTYSNPVAPGGADQWGAQER
jgi:hypothetical protein